MLSTDQFLLPSWFYCHSIQSRLDPAQQMGSAKGLMHCDPLTPVEEQGLRPRQMAATSWKEKQAALPAAPKSSMTPFLFVCLGDATPTWVYLESKEIN